MQSKDIKEKLKSLIDEASTTDPNLARRLEEVYRWVKGVKPGSLTAKRLVILFLLQIIDDAEVWLKIKSLPSEEEQQSALDELNPALKYWYGYLFAKWLSENDPKFHVWRQKLMSEEFSKEDDKLLECITGDIKQRGGHVVRRYITDLSMATDIIISTGQEKPLCIQLTTLSEEHFQQKLNDWENTLVFWLIERGLFLSFNPSQTEFVHKIVNVALHNSRSLKSGDYFKFSL